MFYAVGLFFMLFSQLLPLCRASDLEVPLYTASSFHSEIEDENSVNDVRYRCDRSVLELPPQAVGELFNITKTTPYDSSKISDVKKELYNLWGSEEIKSEIWNLSKLALEDSSLVTEIKTKLHLERSSDELCTVKVWNCTRNFREANCPVGSIWFFWNDIKHLMPNSTANDLSEKLSKWCSDFVNHELVSREIILTAHRNGVYPAMRVFQWLVSKNKGQNLKVVFFDPPVDLIENLTEIPQEKTLLMFSSNREYNHGTVIAGSFRNKQDVVRLYEVEKARILTSSGMPVQAGGNEEWQYARIGGGTVVAGAALTGILIACHCIIS